MSGLEQKILNPIIISLVEDLLSVKGLLPATKPPEIATKPIDEYEDRLRVKITDKFDTAVYIAVISFYLNKSDLQAHRARGAMVVYMDTEVADKLFKAAGLKVPYDEDDESMMQLCGSLAQTFADGLREKLALQGFVNLEASSPAVFKNTVAEGVEFSRDQKEKQEISFYFLKHKAIVIDWTMAAIPKK